MVVGTIKYHKSILYIFHISDWLVVCIIETSTTVDVGWIEIDQKGIVRYVFMYAVNFVVLFSSEM